MVNQKALHALRGVRSATLSVLLGTASMACGQASGFNFTLGYVHPFIQQEEFSVAPSVTLGLAYQHDFEPRFGVAFDFFYASESNGLKSNEFIYSAKFFTSDNDATAFYIGSFVGVQSLKGVVSVVDVNAGMATARRVEISKLQFPIGVRAGVRGGLDGYFAELFTQVGYAIGSGELYMQEGKAVNSSPLYMCVGFSFLGFGWDHRNR